MSKQKRPINLIISLLSLLLFICAVVTIIHQLKKYNYWELINSVKAITSIHHHRFSGLQLVAGLSYKVRPATN